MLLPEAGHQSHVIEIKEGRPPVYAGRCCMVSISLYYADVAYADVPSQMPYADVASQMAELIAATKLGVPERLRFVAVQHVFGIPLSCWRSIC